MISKRFYYQIIIRICLIIANCLAFIPFIIQQERIFTIFSLAILFIIQVVILINYINKFNRSIFDFFNSLKANDASFAFHDKIFPNISNQFRDNIVYVRNQLFEITKSKEIQYSYFKSIIENAQTGIITINQLNRIDVINRKAKEILKIKDLKNIEEIKKEYPQLYQYIANSHAGSEDLVIVKQELNQVPLSVRVTEFKQNQNNFKLISFHNIQSELNINEIDSWNKLIRILTHEINNTLSPLISLASSLQGLYYKDNTPITSKEIHDGLVQKTTDGLNIIKERGNGLIGFVKNYRRISLLNEISKEIIKVAELFYNLELLLKTDLERKNIQLKIDIKPFDLDLYADKKYLEQIAINLIKNSIDAINHENGIITLKAFKNKNDKVILSVTDNGKGIPPEIKEQVFIPFFTTKEQGSGIGLSLARQIMRLHGGTISVDSTPQKVTTFTLTF